MNNLRLLGLKSFLISGFLFFSSVAFAQTASDSIYQAWLYKKQKRTAFLNEPYIFMGFGIGPNIGIPAIRKTQLLENSVSISKSSYANSDVSFFFNGRFFVGAHYKRHYFTLQAEDLLISNNIGLSYTTPDGGGSFSFFSYDILPYISLMYQYDVLNNNKKIALQPGFHAGIAVIGDRDKIFEIGSSSGGGGLPLDKHRLKGNTETLQKIGFGFGPSLNFEVNFGRCFSLNLYQQLSYIAGPVLQNNITYILNDEPPYYGVTKSNILNYSMNIALRFKMYLPKTRFKVAEKLSAP